MASIRETPISRDSSALASVADRASRAEHFHPSLDGIPRLSIITNAPGTIGGFVSHGCIRMYDEDIMDLYSRVGVGTRVVVTR